MTLVTPDLQRETQVPQIPDPRQDNMLAVLKAIKEVLDVREGISGDPLDQVLTPRDLYHMGQLDTSALNGKVYVRLPGYGIAYLQPNKVVSPEYNPPPAPTGLVATGAIATVLLTWDAPNYHGHSLTEVWRSATDDFGTAVRIGTAPGGIYSDDLGATNATRYYWIRFRSKTNVPGPLNATAGTSATTARIDTLDILAGAVQQSHLVASLSTRIDLIDAAAGVAGSVNARILTEETSRISADMALASDITTLSATVNGNTAAIQTEASVRATAVAADYSSSSTYAVGDHVQYNNQVYRCITAVAVPEAFNALKWQAVTAGLYAQYTVKVDLNGRVAGFGLASTAINGTPTSEFVVIADRFAIVNPSSTGEVPKVPFVVGTVDGATVVAMDNAFIQDAAIVQAKIGLLAVDDARIASLHGAKITAGSVEAAKLNVAELSAITANMGAITAGTIALSTSGHIRSGQSAYNTGNGFWLGIDTGVTKFSLGDPLGNYLRWTGSALEIGGSIIQNDNLAGGITGAKISSATTITAGSSNDVAVLSGDDATYRIWAGHASAASAPFSVQKDGTVTIKHASSGARLEITSTVIKVYDASDVLRVQLGDLS